MSRAANNLIHLPRKRDLTETAHELGGRTGDLALRGRLAGRRAGRGLRRGALRAADFAEDMGERSAEQAVRLGRQAKRHPAATIGIAAAAIGAVFLGRKLWKQRQQQRRVQSPIIDDIDG
ncbi:hypothetical protein [Oleiagrimonas sp. C23AA]|uniref:hypothetical protein n=1 Tax=Oleiagrimonas sp. C23AA TaxID=2719047 RepID=UPI00141E7F17|nr:hypothetical protein [Oleiagrimonas sp. C23AA]NII11948.1 hypothetical protein [Oleiagrimonas sp. C23AA]